MWCYSMTINRCKTVLFAAMGSEKVRTLVATMMSNSKGKNVFCSASKVSEYQMRVIRNTEWADLEDIGFTFIDLASPEYPNIRGKAIFFEGHLDEMGRALKNIDK